MKKKVTLILAVVMFTISCMPVYISAADEGLEKAIKSVKQYFTIPDNYKEFNYGISSIGDNKIWELNWSSKDGENGSIGASVDSNGEIINYSLYNHADYGNSKKLPKLSRQEAKTKAEEIIKKINPGIFDSLKFVDTYQGVLNEEAYYFNYIRTYNSIPFPQNSISVGINRRTGELQRYSKQWNDDINFPSSEKALSIEEAQKAYIKNFGLRLTYNSIINEDKTEVYASYTPIYNSNYYIEASTGERVFLGYIYSGADDGAYNLSQKDATMAGRGEGVELSPQEIDAINEVSKLLSKEEVEKKVREIKFLELDENYILDHANLTTSWTSKTDLVWNVYFEKQISQDNKEYDHVYVTIDARTGEITSFSKPYRDTSDKEPGFDRNASKDEVEKLNK